jgi:hypothetical protein
VEEFFAAPVQARVVIGFVEHLGELGS